MKKKILALFVASCIGVVVVLSFFQFQSTRYAQQLTGENVTLKKELLGYKR